LSLLLDENLSPRLAIRLASLLPGLIHVRDVALKQADDQEIWDWAKENGTTWSLPMLIFWRCSIGMDRRPN
jgi:predicted nuclease of predicted toxin-antitoxin system